MYKKIYVPLDNSAHANSCMDFSIALAKATGAALVGSHVYAAKMHDMRFKQMEFTLPEQYRAEAELEKQRRTHDSLIAEGLRLISHSYLDVMEKRCAEHELPFEKKTFDGRNYQELVKDIRASDYDLVVMGAHGQGAVKGSLLGSVTERVVRRIQVDTLIVKDVQPWETQVNGHSSNGPIVVALDGSPHAFHGLKIGMLLARKFNKPLHGVAVYDPYLHYGIFHSIADVLSDEAARVFKFKEQEQLHEEVIDSGLARIYQSHLEVGKRLVEAEGLEMEVTLLPGKPYEKILHYVDKQNAWLLICGRIGIHSEPDMDIGSNSENLLRRVPCHMLLASGQLVPPIELNADASIEWTKEALSRMDNVPDFVRGVARQAILRWAVERGHSVITSGVIDEAMRDVLPPCAASAMGVERAAARARNAEEAVYVCNTCGHTVPRKPPVKCRVCEAAGKNFTKVDKAAIESKAQHEGDLEAQTTFDGVRLFWTEEAKQALQAARSGPARRCARARIEKQARVQKLSKITRELVLSVVKEEAGH
ncbi:MAG: universal stress protein [bacterium]